MKEKWIADFSKPDRSCFIIKPEISSYAKIEKGVLFLGLKKNNCMAWLETENRVYVNQVINARFRFDSPGEGYHAAGIMFRITSGTYYLALISSMGYFRLDAVSDNIPKPLIGWTEAPGLNGREANLGIIARDDHLIFSLNGRWLAEANDASIPGGHLGFALVSYDSEPSGEKYSCRAWLDYLSVDSRNSTVEAEYKKWNENTEVSAESRFRLAESLAILDCFDASYQQILKAWEQREETARSVTATYTEMRTKSELLFAARMALRTGQYATAEDYINDSLTAGDSLSTGVPLTDIYAEKAKILSAQNKFNELAAFLPEYISLAETADSACTVGTHTGGTHIPSLYALLGHACWHLRDYKAAADAWDKALASDPDNGLYAASAANAYEMMGKNNEALQRFLNSAEHFLQQQNYRETEALIPKILSFGKDNPYAHELAAKWAAATGNTEMAAAETALKEKLQQDLENANRIARPSPPDDAKTGTPQPAPAVKKSPAKAPRASTKKKTEKKPAIKTKAGTAKKTAAKTKPAAAKKTTAVKKPASAPKKATAKKPAAKTAAKAKPKKR